MDAEIEALLAEDEEDEGSKIQVQLAIITIEGSLEVKLPTIWTNGKAEVGRVREEKGRGKIGRERARRKKMQVRRANRYQVEKSPFTMFFHWFVADEGLNLGSLKWRVQSHLAR